MAVSNDAKEVELKNKIKEQIAQTTKAQTKEKEYTFKIKNINFIEAKKTEIIQKLEAEL